MKSFRRCIKAVSPVIATIIIVAIAITMSIAVAYWVLGLGSSFTKYEKVEFTSAYADAVSNTNLTFADGSSAVNVTGWIISMDVKNTGSAAATIDPTTIFYNGKPATAATYVNFNPVTNFNATTMQPGESKINMQIGMNATGTSGILESPWKSGMTIEVMLQTSAGKQYPKVITLP